MEVCYGRCFLVRFSHCAGDLDSSKSPYICGVCGQEFARFFGLQSHKRMHKLVTPKFKCRYCDKFLSRRVVLINHVCDFSFFLSFISFLGAYSYRRKAFFVFFLWEEISREELYATTRKVCLDEFYPVPILNCGCRIHTKERPYPCTYCGMTFAHCGNRRNHERSHEREKVKNE